MSETERFQLIETLLKLVVSNKHLCSPKLQAAEKQQLQATMWSVYDYTAQAQITSLSVYSYIYKAYYELCVGATILTSKSPYYEPLQTLALKMAEIIQQENISLEKVLLGSTTLSDITTQAHTRLSYFVAGSLSFDLSNVAKLLFM